MDAYAHVNNTTYFKYQEVGRLQFFSELVEFIKSCDSNHLDFDKEKFASDYIGGKGVGPILSDTFAAFKFPLTFPDRILVGSTVNSGDIQHDRFKLTHTIWSLKWSRKVAEGYGTVVNYDYHNHKVVEMPLAVREAIEKIAARDNTHLETEFKLDRTDFLDRDF